MDRQLMVDAVRTWIGTPYHHLARVKGVGVDCGQLVIAALLECGAITEDPGPAFYTPDWHLHRNEDKYLQAVEKVLVRRAGDDERSVDARCAADASYALPAGEVIVFRVGRTFSHGGVITQWPRFIHSYLPSGIVEEVDIRGTPMSERVARVYTFEGYDA